MPGLVAQAQTATGTMTHRRKTSPPPLALSAKAARTREQPISYLMAAAVERPDLISFAAGLVDPLTLPAQECLQITQRLLSDPRTASVALQYDTTLGLAPLRKRLLDHLLQLDGKSADQLSLSPSQILITTGSQQALYLVADVLLDVGDIVITANPSYFVYTATLQSLGAQVLTAPMDDDGMDVEAVATLLGRLEKDGRLSRVKFIYCTSFYQNPTGLTLSAERRRRLVQIVRQFSRFHRILIVEDAAYRELRYDGAALPSIKSFDPDNLYTVLTQTFSKPFAPGLKTGYTALPADLVDPIAQQKGNHDFGSANLPQQIVLEAMRDGSYEKHLASLCAEYRRKRDLMLAALRKHMPKSKALHWTRPSGGLYVWLTLPDGINASRGGELFQRCHDRGVLYVPGEYCFQPDDDGIVPKNHIRLSFGQVHAEQIETGIERLAEAVRRTGFQPVQKRQPGRPSHKRQPGRPSKERQPGRLSHEEQEERIFP